MADDLQVRQWVDRWHAYLLSKGPRVFTWQPGGGEAKLLVDLGPLLGLSEYFDEPQAISVSSDGTKLAAASESEVAVMDLTSKKLLFWLHRSDIKRATKHDLGLMGNFGVAWSPNGRELAVAVGGRPNKKSSDGSALAECITVGVGKRIRYIGRGAPVAWLSSTILLCGADRPHDFKKRPVIYDLDKHTVRKGSLYGSDVSWDGEHILVGLRGSIQSYSKTFRKTGTISVPPYRDRSAFQPPPTLVSFVGKASKAGSQRRTSPPLKGNVQCAGARATQGCRRYNRRWQTSEN